MASAFGHAAIALALGQSFKKQRHHFKFWFIAIACTILPDADVVSFSFGIPYEAFWGHRGFTHSLVFAALWSAFMILLFYRNTPYRFCYKYFLFFFICTASHGILDGMTSGGLGVAYLAPFDNTRYFLPWRPIKVSPIGIEKFFSTWGMKVILSEIIWIGLPAGITALVLRNKRQYKNR